MGLIGMKQNKILFTGFKNSSAETLLSQISNTCCDTFLFTNDYTTIIYETDKIFQQNYDYIVMLGQKPLIKKLSIELIAKQKKEIIKTNFPVENLIQILKEKDIAYKFSEHPGTSFCNFAYWNMLKCCEINERNEKIIFIHIPYINNFVEEKEIIHLINNIKL